MEGTIELDCKPGYPRPGDLILEIVKGTLLEGKLLPYNTASRDWGNWTWKFEMTDEEYNKTQPILKQRISGLHAEGIIRYGSW